MYERTITMGSAGKTWSCTGWKIGWSIGPPDLIKAMQVQSARISCSFFDEKSFLFFLYFFLFDLLDCVAKLILHLRDSAPRSVRSILPNWNGTPLRWTSKRQPRFLLPNFNRSRTQAKAGKDGENLGERWNEADHSQRRLLYDRWCQSFGEGYSRGGIGRF